MATDNPNRNSEAEQSENGGGLISLKVGSVELLGLRLKDVRLLIETADYDWLLLVVVGLLLLAVVAVGVFLLAP